MKQRPSRQNPNWEIFIIFGALLLFGSGAVGLITPKQALALTDAILAVVNDDVITMNDLRRFVQARINHLRAQGFSAAAIRSQIDDLEINGLQRLIEEKLIAQAAREMGMTIRPEALQQRLDQIIQAYESRDDFMQSLSVLGLSLSEFKAMLEEQMLVQAVIEEHISRTIHVSPSEVTAYYREHKEEFQRPETLRLDGLFIPAEDDLQRARAHAQEAWHRLKEGESFEKVRNDVNASNPLKKVRRGQLKPDLEEKIFSLKEGEISDVIETEQGFYIVKIIERLPPDNRPLTAVHDEIEERLFRRKFQVKLQEWLDELKRNSHVEIRHMTVSQSVPNP